MIVVHHHPVREKLEPKDWQNILILGDVPGRGIDPAKRVTLFDIGALDVEPACGLNRRRRFAIRGAEPLAQDERVLPAGQRTPPRTGLRSLPFACLCRAFYFGASADCIRPRAASY